MKTHAWLAAPTHPDFARVAGENIGLLFHTATLCRKFFGGRIADYLGVMALRLNYMLAYFDPTRGTLSTLLRAFLYDDVLRYAVAFDSESWRNFYHSRRRVRDGKAATLPPLSLDALPPKLRDSKFYFAPDDDDREWTDQILDLFETRDKAWAFLTRDLPERYVNILTWYYKDDKTFKDIAELLKVTKQRVQQIHARTLETIRQRLKTLEAARELFFGEQPDEFDDAA